LGKSTGNMHFKTIPTELIINCRALKRKEQKWLKQTNKFPIKIIFKYENNATVKHFYS
jgi:gluconate kinase